jgi:AraC-like DNA-binding protein
VVTGDKLLAPGRSITIRPHTRFVAFPEHTHDYVEMVYMCQGSTTHTVNGQVLVLQAGDLLFLGQNARQSIAPAGERDLAVNFIVRPSFFSATLPLWGEEETPLRRFILSCLTGQSESGWLLFHVGDVVCIQNLLENLVDSLLHESSNRQTVLRLTMSLLFAQLLQYTQRAELSSQTQTLLLTALRYIETHYTDGSLGELAKTQHYELSTLSRLIRQQTGQSYTELVQEKRLSQAAWLLKNTDKHVSEIAALVGYENKSYFHRLFTARFGASPRQYRICK